MAALGGIRRPRLRARRTAVAAIVAAALTACAGCALVVGPPAQGPAAPPVDVVDEAAPAPSLTWRDACLLGVDEVTAIVQPLVDDGWAQWSRAVATEDGGGSDGSVTCSYEGDEGFTVIEIDIYPVSVDDEPTFTERCAEVQARPPFSYEPDTQAICDPSVGGGMVLTKDRGLAFLFPGENYTARVWMLTVGLGSQLTDPLTRLSQAITDRWTLG